MRLLYSLAWWLALPLVVLRLWWRGRKEPGYRAHWSERLGFYSPATAARRVIWVHAVSVGETRAAEPLVDALLASYPERQVLLTHMTPTGRATGKSLFASRGPRLMQCYLPYDINWMLGRFLRHFAPSICILMETEVWPNLIAQCRKRGIPVALVNARLSKRSLAKAHRLGSLMREAAQGITAVAAQTQADAQRLQAMGVQEIRVTGSIKFDVCPPSTAISKGLAFRQRIGERAVLLCASTREGEEQAILEQLVKKPLPSAVLVIIVPRHPQRFEEVARLITAHGSEMRRRADLEEGTIPAHVRVLLGDSMGEMFAYYAACDLAFIGGSLLPLGGQNLIEPASLGKPVLIGPHTFNFSDATEAAIAAGGARRVRDAAHMLEVAAQLLQSDDARLQMGARARAFWEQHRGATGRVMELVHALLARPRP